MQNKEFMPKGGVMELKKSPSGRRYLGELQEKYKLDLIQPKDPMFNKVYGDKFKRDKQIREKQEIMAKGEWEEVRVKREYLQKKQKDPGYKQYY